MLTEENKNIVRRAVEEIWNKGNMAVANELLAANFVNHDPCGTPETSNLEAYKQSASDTRTDSLTSMSPLRSRLPKGTRL